MKINKKNPLHWLLLLQQGIYTVIASLFRLVGTGKTKPVVVLYGHQLSGNLKALYDEWHRNRSQDFEFYFLSLDPQYSRKLRTEGAQVLQCSRLRDMLKVGSARAIITDHGLHAMRPFLTLTDIILIDVWHGIPFKGFTPENFRVQHRYQETWVSSPALQRIYEQQYGFSPEKIINLGYARADKLFRKEPPRSNVSRLLNIPSGNKIVLYAPTWQQDDNGRELFPFGTNQQEFIKSLHEVCAKYSATLLIRSHLNASIQQGDMAGVRYCSMKDFPDTEDILQNTDVLICDWSSIAFDYLALARPVIFLDVEPPFKNGFSLGPEFRYGDIAGCMKTLTHSLNEILSQPEEFLHARNEKYAQVTREAYGENTDGTASAKQLEHLWSLVQ